MITFLSKNNYTASNNTIAGKIYLSDYCNISSEQNCSNAFINLGGWQSWNPGFEIEPGKKQPSLKCHFIHQWNQYLVFPGTKFSPSKNIVLSQFVTYFRWENQNKDFYLVLASSGNVNKDNPLPPVQFIINRKENSVLIEISDKGKNWKKDELQAQIEIFTAESMEECRTQLIKIFGSAEKSSSEYSTRFNQLQHLDSPIFGWESWYNHYANINESLILEDLYALKSTENLIKLSGTKHPVFQIDDGWEKTLGDWDCNYTSFPSGLTCITQKISEENFIPGLWLAPFIIDSRSETAKQHPEWLLKNKKGKLIPAGFNPLWGKHGSFYALDLSQTEVLEHLDILMDKIINHWGFRYIKLDFLYAGMIDGCHKNSGAAFEFYIKALKIITSRLQNNEGSPVCYLGCGVPFELSFQYLPLSRIGCDTYEHWENRLLKNLNWNGRNSAYLNLKDTIGHKMWDKIIFANDPDVIFIREDNCTLTREQKITIAENNIKYGSQIMYSDDPAKMTEDDIKLTKEIISLLKQQEK